MEVLVAQFMEVLTPSLSRSCEDDVEESVFNESPSSSVTQCGRVPGTQPSLLAE